jgi:ammonia channel protein AmtB
MSKPIKYTLIFALVFLVVMSYLVYYPHCSWFWCDPLGWAEYKVRDAARWVAINPVIVTLFNLLACRLLRRENPVYEEARQ